MYSWHRVDISAIRGSLIELPSFLRPRPNIGIFAIDLVFIIMLAAVQQAILPSIFGGYIGVDLLTSWLTVTIIKQSFVRSAFLVIAASLLIETHAVVPAGLYFCAYGCLLVTITNAKEILSWNVRVPWFVSTAVANIWVFLFEMLILYLVSPAAELDLINWLYLAIRLPLSMIWGLFLANHEFMSRSR